MDLYVAFGGQSAEHEVSIKSAYNVLSGADRGKYKVFGLYIHRDGLWSVFRPEADISLADFQALAANIPGEDKITVLHKHFSDRREKVFFPIIHGLNGEDGTIQGFFEYLDVPYVGCPVLASSVGMEKSAMKLLAQALGIPMADYVCITRADYEKDKAAAFHHIENHMAYPYFIKPSKGGSSIGISPAHSREELEGALNLAFRYDGKAVVEKLVTGREIEFGLLGNGGEAECSQPGEFVRNPSFFDYHAKYLDEGLRMNIPAAVPPEAVAQMVRYSRRMFEEMGGAGMSRVDFFYTDQGQVLFNEINTAPGFTSVSMYPSLWQATKGMDTAALVDRLIELALALYEEKKQLQL